MNKLFGLVLIGLLVWAAAEVYMKGTDHAFGGLFTGFSSEAAAATEPKPVYEKVGNKVNEEFQRGYDRTDKALSE